MLRRDIRRSRVELLVLVLPDILRRGNLDTREANLEDGVSYIAPGPICPIVETRVRIEYLANHYRAAVSWADCNAEAEATYNEIVVVPVACLDVNLVAAQKNVWILIDILWFHVFFEWINEKDNDEEVGDGNY